MSPPFRASLLAALAAFALGVTSSAHAQTVPDPAFAALDPLLDPDGDGLTTGDELLAGTNPLDGDSDEDGLADGDEPAWNLDTDGDGAINALDVDSDADSIKDGTEVGLTVPSPDTDLAIGYFRPDQDPSTVTDPLNLDSDGGGVIDGYEDMNRDGAVDSDETDPLDPCDDKPDSAAKCDGDQGGGDDDGDQDTQPGGGGDDDGDQDTQPGGGGDDDGDQDTQPGGGGGGDDGDQDTDASDGGPGGPGNEVIDGSLVDPDLDGIPSGQDNCPNSANADLYDLDGDGLGDACDIDADGDGVDDDVGVTGGGCAVTTAAPSAHSDRDAIGFALLLLIAAAAVAIRRGARRPGIVAAVAAVAALAATPAHAQETSFEVDRYRPAYDDGGILDVEGGAVPRKGSWGLGFALSASDDPLVTYRDTPMGRERIGSLVSTRVTGSMVGAWAFHPKLQLGLHVPVVVYQDYNNFDGSMTTPGGSTFGLGDVRAAVKWQLLSEDRHIVDLAVVPAFTFPTSTDDHYTGESSITFVPEVAASRRLGRFRLGSNLGWRVRKNQSVANLEVADEMYVRMGAGFQVTRPIEVSATVTAIAPAGQLGAANQNTVEVLGGVSYRFGWSWLGYAAAGTGTDSGMGTPDWRFVVGARMAVGRRAAQVPSPDISDFVEEPPPSVPAVPELIDSDGDGILDDGCPDEPEDLDGHEDDDGCPEADNDADGLLDGEDACPMDAGPRENSGCPDLDRDGDTVIDRLDNCPLEPGTIEESGCPGRQLVRLTDGSIDILDRVHFDTNRARVKRKFQPVLRNVAQVILAHPDMVIQIEGHADERGTDAYNLDLSRRRAQAVRTFLIAEGVPAERLEAVGYGEGRPDIPGSHGVALAKNRRVQFFIVSRGAPANATPAAPLVPVEPAAPAPAPAPVPSPLEP